VDRGQLAAEDVERHLRPGEVGDQQVEEPGRDVDRRGRAERRRAKSRNRVGEADRQRPAHRGQFVAELAVLVFGPDRDRDQGLELEPGDGVAASGQPAAQGAGDDGQGDVVYGVAEGVPGPGSRRRRGYRRTSGPRRSPCARLAFSCARNEVSNDVSLSMWRCGMAPSPPLEGTDRRHARRTAERGTQATAERVPPLSSSSSPCSSSSAISRGRRRETTLVTPSPPMLTP